MCKRCIHNDIVILPFQKFIVVVSVLCSPRHAEGEVAEVPLVRERVESIPGKERVEARVAGRTSQASRPGCSWQRSSKGYRI